jgi:hypothetical protein
LLTLSEVPAKPLDSRGSRAAAGSKKQAGRVADFGFDSELARAAELLVPARASFSYRMSTRGLHSCIQHRRRLELTPAGSQKMLWTVFAILLLLWLLGWGFHVAGSLIHLILVIALVVLVIELITGRRAAV